MPELGQQIASDFTAVPGVQVRPSPIASTDSPRLTDDVSIAPPSRAIHIPDTGKPLREIEAEAVEMTMRLTQFNQTAAARILGISRPTLLRKLREHGLKRENERGTEVTSRADDQSDMVVPRWVKA
jgi:DNA-binding NtrC family response regulator